MGHGVTVRCAGCGHNFDTKIHGNLACPYCHAQVYLEPSERTSGQPETHPTPSATESTQPPPPAQPPSAPEELSPITDAPNKPAYRLDLLISALTQLAWEGQHYNILKRFWFSMKQILFAPSIVFADLEIQHIRKALWFGWIVCSLGMAFFFLYNLHLIDANRDIILERFISSGAMSKTEAVQRLDAQRASYEFGAYGGFLILAIVNIWLSALLNHLGVLLTIGKKNRGFRATLKGTAYSFAPFVLLVIPLPPLVILIAVVWSITIQIIAIGKIHQSTLARASQAVLLPLFAVMLLMMLPFWG